MHASSIIVLLAGLFSGFVFLAFNVNAKVNTSISRPPKSTLLVGLLITAVSLYLFTWPMETIDYIATKYPVDYSKPKGSDIIPQMGILVNRLISGEFPYQAIGSDDWDRSFTLFPTYLPLQWLPYSFAEILKLDYRIYAFIIFAVFNLYLVIQNIRANSNFWSTLVLGILPPLILVGFLSNDTTGGFRHSVELLIVTYYTLLASTLIRFNWVSMSIAVAICLLSRYSVVLWVPLFLFVLYRVKGRTILLKSMGLMLLMFGIFYLPFLLIDPLIYFKGYEYHTGAAIGAWNISPWQPDTDTGPFNLIHGVGMGIFFYEYVTGDIVDKLNACRLGHLIASISSVILMGIWYFKNESKVLPGLFLLGSLKIYLVVFYNFIQIPFIYLYWILPMISVVMLAVVLNQSTSECRNISNSKS